MDGHRAAGASVPGSGAGTGCRGLRPVHFAGRRREPADIDPARLSGTYTDAVRTLNDYVVHTVGLERALYCAFGHIHNPQLLPSGTAGGRYAGSLVPLNYSERVQRKQVVLVSIADDVRIEEREIATGRPLVEMDGSLDELERRRRRGPGPPYPEGTHPLRGSDSRPRRFTAPAALVSELLRAALAGAGEQTIPDLGASDALQAFTAAGRVA